MPTSISFWDHSIETIERALNIRKQIEALKASVDHIMGGGTSGAVTKRRGRPAKAASLSTKADRRKEKRSPAAKAKMAAAQKARWAAKRGGASADIAAPVVNGTEKKKRTMSPEGRARIAAAQKARWAKVKG